MMINDDPFVRRLCQRLGPGAAHVSHQSLPRWTTPIELVGAKGCLRFHWPLPKAWALAEALWTARCAVRGPGAPHLRHRWTCTGWFDENGQLAFGLWSDGLTLLKRLGTAPTVWNDLLLLTEMVNDVSAQTDATPLPQSPVHVATPKPPQRSP